MAGNYIKFIALISGIFPNNTQKKFHCKKIENQISKSDIDSNRKTIFRSSIKINLKMTTKTAQFIRRQF